MGVPDRTPFPLSLLSVSLSLSLSLPARADLESLTHALLCTPGDGMEGMQEVEEERKSFRGINAEEGGRREMGWDGGSFLWWCCEVQRMEGRV